MQKDGSIVISDWQKGLGDSAVLGVDTLTGLDIFDELGVLKIKEGALPSNTAINTQGITQSTIVAGVSDDSGRYTFVTSAGYIVHDESILTSPVTECYDALVYNKDFVIVSYKNGGSGRIGVISRSTGSATWHADKIIGLANDYVIKLLVAQDGFVYFTNGNYIGRITNITESLGIVTVLSTSNALDLKRDVYASSLVELGNDLLIGTHKGFAYSARVDYQFANIYKWDRTSPSFRLPMQVNESGINAMIQKDNLVYFSAGVNGNIYMTNGTDYQKIKTLPFSKIKKFGATSTVYWNAMSVNQAGNLVVGLSVYTDITPNNLSKFGVYEISLTSGYPTSLSYTGLSGETGKTSLLSIGFVKPFSFDQLMYSSYSSNLSKVMITSASKNTNYLATYESPVYFVGSRQSRKSYQSIEFTLTEPLIAGQFIRISYRKSLVDAWTEIGDWGYTNVSGISHYDKALIADAEAIQIQIKLTQDPGTIFPYNVKLLRVILR
jgi:hypothetical protein